MEIQNFTREDIPYDILEGFGLTRKMIDDLPKSVLQKLLTGRATPPLPVEDRTQDGETSHAVSRIALFRRDDGKMDVFFIPRLELMDIGEFPELSGDSLRRGKVLRTDRGYAQYNEVIDQVRTVPYGIVLHNLENIQEIVGFTQKDRDTILKGSPVVITEGEYRGCTIGIDLAHENMIRLSKGDGEQHGQVQLRHVRVLGLRRQQPHALREDAGL